MYTFDKKLLLECRETAWSPIGKDVFYFLSFNLYTQRIVWKVELDLNEGGVNIGARNIINLRYDDTRKQQ